MSRSRESTLAISQNAISGVLTYRAVFDSHERPRMKRPFANRGFDSASRASKACVRHGRVNQRSIRKEAIPYDWRELRRDSRFEEFDGSFCIAFQRATIIPRILERERHALVGAVTPWLAAGMFGVT